MKGKLSLFPQPLGKTADKSFLSCQNLQEAVSSIDGLIAESMTGGLAFLKRFQTKKKPHHMPICLYNKKTPDEDIPFVLEPLLKGEQWGYVSDAGMPCLADPGSKLVKAARLQGLEIQAYYGPTSIMLGIALSGLYAQRFSFHGYLASSENEREKQLRNLEKQSKEQKSLQVFIEAPYRNQALMKSAIKVLDSKTAFALACDLDTPTQEVLCHPIQKWKDIKLEPYAKRPAIFLLDYSAFR